MLKILLKHFSSIFIHDAKLKYEIIVFFLIQCFSTKLFLLLDSRVFCACERASIRESPVCSLENSFRRPTRVNLSAMWYRENRRRNIRKLRPRGGRAGVQRGSSLDRTIADNGIASDFCMPISRPALCRRQCTNNYAKRRPFIRPFGRIQTGLSVSIIVARRK